MVYFCRIALQTEEACGRTAGGEGDDRVGLWIRFKRIIRFHYLRIIRLSTSAHSIALGIALGVFVGALPIIPLQTASVLVLAFIFRANKVSAVICTFYSNVFTLIPFYALLYLVGGFVLHALGMPVERESMSLHELMEYFGTIFKPEDLSMGELFKQGWRFFLVMMLGGVIIGVPSAFGAYFLGRRGVLSFRSHRARRIMRRHLP